MWKNEETLAMEGGDSECNFWGSGEANVCDHKTSIFNIVMLPTIVGMISEDDEKKRRGNVYLLLRQEVNLCACCSFAACCVV